VSPARARAPVTPAAEELALHTVPLTELAGVGPARAARLAALGVNNVHELLCVLPRRLERAGAHCSLAEARAHASKCAHDAGEVEGEPEDSGDFGPTAACRVRGTVVRQRFSRFGARSLLRVAIADGAESLELLFFNQPWLRERFRPGDEVEAEGRPAWAKGAALVVRRLGSATAPLPEPGTLSPVYPGTEGLSQEMLRALCRQALEQFGAHVREPLPSDLLEEHGLLALPEAVRELHEPSDEARHARARARLSLEPLIALRASLEARRRERARTAALVVRVDDNVEAEIRALFPFAFTRGQLAIARTLREDLERGHPMRRLLQGDVGSGKTALGAFACLLAARAGAQAAFLAPTELLAEQHLRGLAPLFARAGLRTAVLCGSLSMRERRAVLAELAAGAIDVAFGTHALFSESVRFARLGLAVIDEQHRFGVAQRERLFDKGRDVHGLLMTATPIPRSLALTVYGDLDVSTLREKPPGRSPVRTRRVLSPRDLIDELEPRLERGERVYWVVPRIESGEEDEVGATERHARIAQGRWARHGVELVHGRLEAQQREERLARFRSGAVRVLVATTVIEVGVDVPEATAIVIESAERLGLAQLHQLRGRVGRGAAASSCYLMGKRSAAARLELLERTDDGFEIAEADLAQRGMGDLLGLRQAGENREGIVSDEVDLALFELADKLCVRAPALLDTYAGRRRLS
jgi:ATP-dependent DNA helicase RecG